MGVHDKEVDSGVDLERWAGRAAPEGVVAIAEEGMLDDEASDVGPDSGASGEGGVAAEEQREPVEAEHHRSAEGDARKGRCDGHDEAESRAGTTGDGQHEPEENKSPFDHPRGTGAAHDEHEEKQHECRET